MKIKANNLTIKKSFEGDTELIFSVADKNNKIAKLISEDTTLKGDISLEFKKWRERRSLDANAYMWVLLGKISKHKDINSTPEELYRHFIKSKGVYEIVPVKKEVSNDYIKRFEAGGKGWICEVLGDSKINGYVNIITYFGSSTYDTKEMKYLIDEVILEAEKLEIETITPKEYEEMISLIGRENV